MSYSSPQSDTDEDVQAAVKEKTEKCLHRLCPPPKWVWNYAAGFTKGACTVAGEF